MPEQEKMKSIYTRTRKIDVSSSKILDVGFVN